MPLESQQDSYNTESRSAARAAQLCAEACFPRSEFGASFNDCFTELTERCTDGNSTECAKTLSTASASPAEGPAPHSGTAFGF